MTEGERIIGVLKWMRGNPDPDEVLRLHGELPPKLSHTIFLYGVKATIEALEADPELLNEIGPMQP